MAELMNRRDWLKTATGLVVGFTFSGLPAFGEQAPGPLAGDGRTLDPKEVDSALSINPDGSVTIYTSKVDVGTGMRIAIAQMAAEELGVDTARITVIDGDTARCPNTGGTGGSTGLTRGGTGRSSSGRDGAPGISRSRRGAAEASRRGPDEIVDGQVRPMAWRSRCRRHLHRGARRRSAACRASRREGAARLSLSLHARRTISATTRCPGQVRRALSIHPGLHRSGHAPRPRHPAAGDGRDARVGR